MMDASQNPRRGPTYEARAARKQAARAYLLADEVQRALEAYLALQREDPEDPEVYLSLGDCYLAAGEVASAAALYEQALHLAPGDAAARARAALVRGELGRHGRGGDLTLPPLHAAEMARLAGALAGRGPQVPEADLARAEQCLREILTDPHPAGRLSDRLEEVDALIPALLALNARRAEEHGQMALARSLEALLEQFGGQTRDAPSASLPGPPGRVALLTGEVGPPPYRLQAAAQSLQRIGTDLLQANRLSLQDLQGVDLVLAFRPHAEPAVLESLAMCAGLGVPVVVDLEWDYEVLPVVHPAYNALGLSTLSQARAYAAALLLADVVTAPTAFQVAALRRQGYPARLLPDLLPSQEPLAAAQDEQGRLRIGWIALPGEVDDGLPLRRVVRRLLREQPQVSLLIVGEPEALALYEDLPEVSYRPWEGEAALPSALQQMDLLTVPLRLTPFNQSKSDLRLLLAGWAGVPWVASPTEAHTAWRAGGRLARTPDEWYRTLKELVADADLRRRLADEGRARAAARGATFARVLWTQVLAEARQACRSRAGAQPLAMGVQAEPAL